MINVLHKLQSISVSLLVGVVFSSPVVAGLDIRPELTVDSVYVSNIDLTTRGEQEQGIPKESDVLIQAAPAIALIAEGSRAKASLDYRYQDIRSSDNSDRDNAYEQLRFDSETELVLNRLFLDADANKTQVVVNPSEPLGSIFDSSQNLTDRRTTSVSPYWLHRFAGGISSQLRYSYDTVRYDDTQVVGSDLNSSEVIVDTAGMQSRLSWRLNYDNDEVDYESFRTTRLEEGGLTASYNLQPSLQLLATAGEESIEIEIQGQPCEAVTSGQLCEFDDSFWLAGFAWSPSSRTTVEMMSGERFYGDTAYTRISHEQASRVLTLSYEEDVTTNAREQLTVENFNRDDVLLAAPGDGDDRFDPQAFTVAVFLERTASVSFVQRFTRILLSLELEEQEREFIEDGLDIANNTEKTRTVEFALDMNLGARAGLTLYYQLDEILTRPASGNFFGTDDRVEGDEIYEYGIDFNWQLKAEVEFVAGIRRLERQSLLQQNEYDQNLFSAGIAMSF